MTVLDQSWKNCRRMWKWISENLPEEFSKFGQAKKDEVIRKLKAKWLKDNQFTKEIPQNCFFVNIVDDMEIHVQVVQQF